MKITFFLLLILLTNSLHCSAQNNADNFKKIQWLVGNWQGEADGMPFYESWTKTSDAKFFNLNYSICGGKAVENERGSIEVRNSEIFYGDNHKLPSFNVVF